MITVPTKCTPVLWSLAGDPLVYLAFVTNTTLTANVYRTCYAQTLNTNLKTAPGLWNITGSFSCCV